MTAQAQNEAIAKWMGWEFMAGNVATMSADHWFSPHGGKYFDLPNYCGDLNAVREAIAKLGDGQYEEFTVHLARASVGNADWGYDMRPLYEATAAQRAEALLTTLSLWKEQ